MQTSGAASIAQSGFGMVMPGAKRVAIGDEPAGQSSSRSRLGSGEMTDGSRVTTTNKPIANSDTEKIRGLAPISHFTQCFLGRKSPLETFVHVNVSSFLCSDIMTCILNRFSPSESSTFVFGEDMKDRVTVSCQSNV